jgi:hypothetical protein
MSDQDSVCPFGQSDAESPTRLRARAKITVQSSEAEPYDQTASSALVEVHLTETFVGDIEGESPVQFCATISLPASSASNDSAENWVDARGPSCFKGQKSLRTARSRRGGLSFPDRGQTNFRGSVVRADLKATLEKGPTERWTTGSND